MNLLIKQKLMLPFAWLSLTSWCYPTISIEKSPFGNKYWTIESATIQPAIDLYMDGKPDTDLLILIEACERDDADRYQADGSIITDRGKLICDEDDTSDEETGTWTYDQKTQKVVIKKHETQKLIEATVKEASANRIVLISTMKSAAGTHTIQSVLKAV